MPLPIIADVFRVTLDWSDSSGEAAHNVMHFSAPGKTTAEVYGIINTRVTQAMWDWASGSMNVFNVDIIKLDGTSATASFSTGSPAKWTGGGTGTPLPQVAGIVKLQTGLRGRSNRGRVFIPGVGEGEVSGNTLIDFAAVQAAWIAFANATATDGAALGVASYVHQNWHQATVINAESKTATQRRRNHR